MQRIKETFLPPRPIFRRSLCFCILAILLLGTVSCSICENTSTNNENNTPKNIISAFDALDKTEVTVPNCENQAKLLNAAQAKLPTKLKATVDGKSQEIEGITWTLNGTYQQKDEEQNVTFTANLPAGYNLKSDVNKPIISVKVEAKKAVIEKITAFDELAEKTKNVDYCTTLADIITAAKLPTELNVTIDNATRTIENITWELKGSFNPSADGYTVELTAVLPDGYEPAAGANLPTITVTVKAKIYVVSAFDNVDAAKNEVSYCEDEKGILDLAKLPTTLNATVDNEKNQTIGVEWKIEGGYTKTPEKKQTVTFTAVLPDGYEWATGVTIPTITITVKAKATVIKKVTAFVELPDNVKKQTVDYCKDKASLEKAANLPEKLSATIEGAEGTQEISDITWTIDREYKGNEDKAQDFTFTAILPDGYKPADDIALPTITVTVKAKPVITYFTPLESVVAKQTVINGDEKSVLAAVKQPKELIAIVDNETPQIIKNIIWKLDGTYTYEAGVKQTLTFTAILPDDYKLKDSVTMPTISVTLMPVITEFTNPEGITVNYCTTEDEFNTAIEGKLPTTLTATVDGKENQTIKNIIWKLDGTYQQKEEVQIITFTAIEPDGYSLKDGVTMPKITVKVLGTGTYELLTIKNGRVIKCDKSATEIKIPSGVTSIDYEAFAGCSSLTSVTIPDSVTSIGNFAFDGCSSLTSVTIPDSVTYIGMQAFDGCSSLTSVTIPDSVTSIGNFAFDGCSSLTSVTIPDSVTSIGMNAFAGCRSLTSVTIPDSVTSIGDITFASCSSLTSITIPDSVTSIGSGTFVDCSSLTSVTIPDSVTFIGNFAFESCSSLTSVTIPDSVTFIGINAFSGCNKLETVNYGGTKANWDKIEGLSSSDLSDKTIIYSDET